MIVLDGQPFLQPVRDIPPDGSENNDWMVPIAKLYGALTDPVPLEGAATMALGRSSGEPLIAAQLRREAPWMGAAIDQIADRVRLDLWAGRPWLSCPPLLLVGPPGAGKTHFARRLGEQAATGSAMLSFAGISSNAEIAGSPRGFKHPQPSFPACAIQRLGTGNPVVVIDEVDKALGGAGMGDPVATLLPMLERSTARSLFDGCLAAPIDLSHIIWILTANSVAALPSPLLSRVTVVKVDGPRPEHVEGLVASLYEAVGRDLGVPPAMFPRLDQDIIAMLGNMFRRTPSVRRLRRAIEMLIAAAIQDRPRTLN